MTLEIEVIREGSRAERDYDSVIDNCKYGFIQQSTVWRNVISGLGPDEPYLLLARDNGRPVGVLPLYLYRGKFGNIITSVPQPGPLGGIASVDGYDDKDALYKALITYAADLGREKKCCLLTIITNPFTRDDALYKKFLLPEYELENFTQFIYLGNSDYIITSKNIKRDLKTSVAGGVTIKEAASAYDFDALYKIHCKRQVEISTIPLDKRLLENIFNIACPANKAKIFLAYHDGSIIAGWILIHDKLITDVFVIAADSAFDRIFPNFALADYSIRWAQGEGARLYNWQSSPGRSSGVYKFKTRWGSEEAGYYFFTKVLGDVSGIMNGNFSEVGGAYTNHFLLPCEVAEKTEGKAFGEFVKNKVKKQ